MIEWQELQQKKLYMVGIKTLILLSKFWLNYSKE